MTDSERLILCGVAAVLVGKYLWDNHRPLLAHVALESALAQMRPEIAAFVRRELVRISAERRRCFP